jgi:hypothetical protein
MFLKICYECTRLAVCAGLASLHAIATRVFGAWGSRGFGVLEVKTCSKALFGVGVGHGKSPCFSDVDFLQSVGPDYAVLVLPSVDGRETLECAFCYGRH